MLIDRLLVAGLVVMAIACTPAVGRPVDLPTWAYPTPPLPSGVELSAPQALAIGRLEAGESDGNRCVWLVGTTGDKALLIWPEGYRAEESVDGIVVHGDDGVVARTGDNVELVGGYGPSNYEGPCGLGEPAFYVGSVDSVHADPE